MIVNVSFPEHELDRLKKQNQASLLQIKDDSGDFADTMFRRFMYQGHPYSIPNEGTIKTLQNITRDDVIKFYNSHLTPKNAYLAVVGDFDSKKMIQKLNRHFSQWKSTQTRQAKLYHPYQHHENLIYVIQKPGLTQSHIRIGNISIERSHKDYFALLVANHVLGGAFTALLNQKIRDDLGLTYSIYSSNRTSLYKGHWQIKTFTKNKTLFKTVEEILKLVQNFDKLATDKELSQAKAHLTGSYLLSKETVEDIAKTLLFYKFFGFDENYLKTWRKSVYNISLKKVKQMAQKYWKTDKLIVTILTSPETSLKNLPLKGKLKILNYKDIQF